MIWQRVKEKVKKEKLNNRDKESLFGETLDGEKNAEFAFTDFQGFSLLKTTWSHMD